MKAKNFKMVAGPGLAALLLAGCAGSIERPVNQFAKAQAAIEQAEDAETQQHAPDRLATAREKLVRARTLSERGKHEEAQRLAEQAEADARVALAYAKAETSEATAAELAESLQTLERELARSSNQ